MVIQKNTAFKWPPPPAIISLTDLDECMCDSRESHPIGCGVVIWYRRFDFLLNRKFRAVEALREVNFGAG